MSRVQSEQASAAAVHPQVQFIDAVSRVHGLVSERAAPKLIYQAVLDGALRLLGGESGALRFVDQADPGWMVAVAVEDQGPEDTGSRLAPPGTRAGIGVPICERGEVIGALVVGTGETRRWTKHDCKTMSAYGEHVELALAVARAHHGARGALTDPLTGLGNRTELLDRLEHRLARAHRDGTEATVLFLDLDRFKLVNDSLGHFVGDQLLIAVADRLPRLCARGRPLRPARR